MWDEYVGLRYHVRWSVLDAVGRRHEALGDGGCSGCFDQGELWCWCCFQVQRCDYRADVVGLECVLDGVGVVVVDCYDWNADFLCLHIVGLYSWFSNWHDEYDGELTLRARTTTLCSPALTMASTMVRPNLPVPPATATMDMLMVVFGWLEVDVCV